MSRISKSLREDATRFPILMKLPLKKNGLVSEKKFKDWATVIEALYGQCLEDSTNISNFEEAKSLLDKIYTIRNSLRSLDKSYSVGLHLLFPKKEEIEETLTILLGDLDAKFPRGDSFWHVTHF